MADIKKLQQDGEEFSPVTHEAAVLNDNNESIAVSYQTAEDDNLNTDDKSIVGAINEVSAYGIRMNDLSDVIEPGDPNNPILVRIEELEDTLVEYIENLINNSSNGTNVISAREALYNMMIEDGYDEATNSMTVDELISLLDDSQIDIGDIKQIACGGYHTVILKNDGSVWTCGWNNNGQLGLGDTNDRIKFTQVTSINNVKQIACGYNHTFIIKNDGSLWTCGLNDKGQLGLGDTTDRTTITQIVTNINNDVKQIICGAFHTFIIKNDGTVWSCGLNEDGRLGLGDTNDRTSFTQVTSINNVKEISCGYYHTFILKNDGTVWACGRNGLGQLGLNDTNNRTTFTQVKTNISDVKQISCGVHTVMLKNDGSIWATGYNNTGQLGLGDTNIRKIFTQVTTNVNNDVKQIACGYYRTSILKNDGSIWCCGDNGSGELGLGDTNDRNVFTQVTTNINNDVKQIACGGSHAFILKNDGSMWSCGYNESGELGLGTTGTNITIFTQVPLLSEYEMNRQKLYYYLLDNSISVTEDMDINTMMSLLINIGGEDTALRDSLASILQDEGVEIEEDDSLSDLIIKVDEEFDNKNNELNESMGDMVFSLSEFISDNGGTVTGEESLSELLNMIFEYGTLTLPISYDIMPVAAGFDSSVLFKNDGSLWGCGVNSKGQLGVGHTSALNSFTQATANISNDVVQVAAGNQHVLVVKNNGELWGSGSNQYGQLGLGGTTSVSVFNKITSGVSDVKQIACGALHSMMVKNDGSLWACGYNPVGQLGTGNTTNQIVFTQISSMSNVAKVVCGYYHTLVLKEDGSVWACGDNSKGQLGNSTTTDTNTFVRCDIENVKDIFCGHYTSFAIKQDGTLWSCGQCDYGQIGRGDGFSTYGPDFKQVLDNVKTGSAGILHTMVIRKDGTVWGCGYNGNGQQGNGIATSMNSFNQITTNTNDAVAIICGARHSILIKSDSSIWVTGQNTSGQLGTGNNTDIGTFTGLSISIGTGNNSGQPEPEPEEPAGPVFGDQQPNTWVTCDDIPTPRTYHVAETVDDKVYVIGGTIDASYTKTAKNECYDPYTNTWTQKTNAPSAKHGAASGMVENKIYYMGGSATNVTNTNNCYDPSTNSWTSKASMTEAKYLMGYTTYNNKIYCVHGLPSGSANETNTNLCYDPSTNAWTSLKTIGTATRTPAVGVINGVMYVIGGYSYTSGNVTLKNVYKYTISSNSVANGTNINFDMEFTNAVALNNKLYMVKPYTKELLSFNGSSWTTVSSQMPYEGYRNVLAVADGKIISICGEDNYSSPVSNIVMYLPN